MPILQKLALIAEMRAAIAGAHAAAAVADALTATAMVDLERRAAQAGGHMFLMPQAD